MGKVKYLLKRISRMNYSGFFDMINLVHDKTGKGKLFLFADMVHCGLKFQAGYVDYDLFEMYNMTEKERATVITRGINNSLIKKYNDPEKMKIFHNKIDFNRHFSKYLKRDWLEVKADDFEGFKEFAGKHARFVAKPVDLACGQGIEIVDTTGKDLREVFEGLLAKSQRLLEEPVVQCKEIAAIHPDSVNTLRVVTLKGHVVVAFLRIGNKHFHVDNFNHEGLAAPVDIHDGIIKYKALKKSGELYTEHPITGVPIVGFKIPRWDEVVKFCEDAAREIPEVGYIGWDVCVMPDDICFIEANEFPGHDIYGLPPHRDKNEGLLPVFQEALKD
ncbi:MAG: hypothetical protein K6E19_00040 [Lachnospiraceae bacterium]|nr:hypothetical protein [Lachnospiraceae bacterium]